MESGDLGCYFASRTIKNYDTRVWLKPQNIARMVRFAAAESQIIRIEVFGGDVKPMHAKIFDDARLAEKIFGALKETAVQRRIFFAA